MRRDPRVLCPPSCRPVPRDQVLPPRRASPATPASPEVRPIPAPKSRLSRDVLPYASFAPRCLLCNENSSWLQKQETLNLPYTHPYNPFQILKIFLSAAILTP